MSQKTHPIGFRLGETAEWKSQWFSKSTRGYVANVLEDKKIRDFIREYVGRAGVKSVRIERFLNRMRVVVHVARPGMVIGRGGSRIELLRGGLEKICGTKPELVVEEVKHPALSAGLVAEEVVRQIERRRYPIRVMALEAEKVMSRGAKGVKIEAAGRLGGSAYARKGRITHGSVPLQTIRAKIDYALRVARTKCGTVGIKVWVYLGEEEI